MEDYAHADVMSASKLYISQRENNLANEGKQLETNHLLNIRFMKKELLSIAILATSALVASSCGNNKKANETSAPQEAVQQTSSHQTFAVNTVKSNIEWEGTKPLGKHDGDIKIKSGEIYFDPANHQLTGGNFVIDMNSIVCDDLEGENKLLLENHLKNEDFFNVSVYPEAKFEITNVSETDQRGRYNIEGNLTIKDVTLNISFFAKVEMDSEDMELEFDTDKIVIDRTKWGVNYASKNVFKDLKDKFIDDNITLEVDLVVSLR